MNKTQTQKGITLIALIITIIVMLILVAVTLVITLGENGIIAKARTAKEQQANRTELENLAFSSEEAENSINDLVYDGKAWNINTGDKVSDSIKYGEPFLCPADDNEGFDFGGSAFIFYEDGSVFMFSGYANADGSSDMYETGTGTYTKSSKQIMLDYLARGSDCERDRVNSVDGVVFKVDYDDFDGVKYLILYDDYQLLTDGSLIWSYDGASEDVKAFIKTLAN